jgi:EpsD family peptidyl-prolyl cis-trans isomerase
MTIAKKISAFLGKPALVGASVVVLLVAGCGKKDGDRPQGQVIGRVGPDDVTIQELENEFRLANIPADKRTDAVTKGALLEIITRKAVARQAITAKLDREPTMQLDLLRDKEQMLARTFQQRKLSGQVAGIGQSDVDQFIGAHPTQFAKRVVFITEQIEIPAQAVTADLAAATKDAKTLADIEKLLGDKKIAMKRSSGGLDSAMLPAQLAQQLQGQQASDVFFARIGGGGVFFKIVETQSKPLSGTEANNLARQLMAREKLEQINQQVAADAQKAATFEGDYAKIMAETPAKTDAVTSTAPAPK